MKKRPGQTWFVTLFLSPALILYGIFVCIPLLQTLQLSFYSFRGVSSQRRWVGFQNFQNLFRDPDFLQVLGNMAMFSLLGGTLVYLIGIVLAHALQSSQPWAKLLRSVYLLPHVLSVVAVAIVWQFIYLPAGGFLVGLGLRGPNEGWLGSTTTALPAVIAAWIWFAFGFYAMLFAAGLQSVPPEVFEAAELDGASGLQRFRSISLPLLFSIRKLATVYVLVHVANVFALVNVMTDGGPARRTESLLTLLYEQGFSHSKFGYASALAVVNVALILVATAIITLRFRRDPVEVKPSR